jgi:oleate hydratase
MKSCFMAGAICWPVATSHRRKVLSVDQDRMGVSSLVSRAPLTKSSCFMAGPICWPVATFHRRAVLSSDQDRMRASSFVSTAPLTGPSCFMAGPICWPVATSVCYRWTRRTRTGCAEAATSGNGLPFCCARNHCLLDIEAAEMKAHIVGGGFGGLAAAALLIRNADVPGQDITIYEADERMGGGFFLGGNATSGYNLPGSVFDSEFRCTFDLLAAIPSLKDPAISVKDEFFAFNKDHPFFDRAHIIDRNGNIVHGPHFGLTLFDGLALARLSLTPEAKLEGRRIQEFFSPRFFSTEFWLLFSTIMGSLPQHSATEFRRYINRTVRLLPNLSDMANIWRTPLNQYEAFIEPLVDWLQKRGLNFLTRAFVRDICFASLPGRMTVDRLDYERDGAATSVDIAPDDIVLVTTGSQAADLSPGTMAAAPRATGSGRSWALWKRLAHGRKEFGNPEVFFDAAGAPERRWVTFTVTTTGTEFIDLITKLTGNEPGTGGLVTLKDSGWLLSFSIFLQPEIRNQPNGTYVWWGYGLYPERIGDFVPKRMADCTGSEILEEVVRQLRFDKHLGSIMTSSICIPCDMPYVNNIWMPRRRGDRPPVVPDGATNLGLIGQYVEIERDVTFTIEYSARTAWEAIRILLKRGPAPPPVYQGQYDLKALWGALKVLVC